MKDRKIEGENMIVLLTITLSIFQQAGGQCSFPSGITNSVWKSSDLGDITFGTDTAMFEVDDVSDNNWICHVSSGNQYVIRSQNSFASASIIGANLYYFYCFDFNQQGTDSYLYYHPTAFEGGERRLLLGTDTTTVAAACSETIDAAEYHVMLKKNTTNTVKHYCASPLLGDFLYTCPTGTENGTLNVCDAYSQQTLAFNHSQCSPSSPVIFSSNGIFNCVAKTSATVSTSTVYYQTLYNTDVSVDSQSSSPTYQFICLAVTEASDGQVSFSYSPTSCVAGQTSTTNTDPVATFQTLTSTTLCRRQDENAGSVISACYWTTVVSASYLLYITN